jgi:outer membrane protein assembly factor BamB
VREAASGSALWSQPITLHTGSPSVVSDAGTVYVSDGSVEALDAHTGTRRWRADLPFASLASPLVLVGDQLVLATNQFVVALDGQTGQVRWQQAVQAYTGYPLLTVVGDVAYTGVGQVRAFRLSDGTLLWTALGSDEIAARLVPAGQQLLVVTMTSRLVDVDAATGKAQWSEQDVAWQIQHAQVRGSVVVVTQRGFTASEQVVGRQLADGQVLWQHTLPAPMALSYDRTPQILADPGGVLIVSGGTGSAVSLVDPTSGATHWSETEPASIDAVVAFPGRVVLLDEDGTATLRDGGAGQVRTQHRSSGQPNGQYFLTWVAQGTLLASIQVDGTWTLWNAATGQVRWQHGHGNPPDGGLVALAFQQGPA